MPRNSAVEQRALRAVGRTRALGLHFYGHFLGVTGPPPADGRALLRSDGEPPGVPRSASTVPSVGVVASLSDLALGAAIRTRVSPGALLATVTLSLQLWGRAAADADVRAEAVAGPVLDGHGTARCVLSAGGVAAGHGYGWFSAVAPPAEVAPGLMPWEHPAPPPVVVPAPAELDGREAAAVRAAVAAGERARRSGATVSRELLALDWDASPEGRSAGRLATGPAVANRAGHIQGGALFDAAAAAAERALAAPSAILVDGHYQFLRPVGAGVVTVTGRVLRHGRRLAFVDAEVVADGRHAGLGRFGFRLEPRASGTA